ncbi:MAG TPA: hypothetical protein PK186_06965 [candidate division Zixibacteria bacterium]|nr:hypothetical protein [candidate division Zixibacteria bacterium]MDD4918203.1 hypothetical protein [candidate division Zixibacteria bacterium]MDM7973707.1 hypothetical protein [candidate division Zixibacteria bacterium]HOD66569.1 hypothetical protein [candidate division Zixibacteria bacterium]HPC12061.1 hypothetical protein [candidate division Zixibacteria bacterium]
MLTILIAAWLVSPLYPLNPVVEDTVNGVNMHFTIGVGGPNVLTDPGLLISAKYEFLLRHPFLLRACADYGFAAMRSKTYPDGALHSMILSAEILLYRGTDAMTGFVGMGPLLYKGYFRFDGLEPTDFVPGAVGLDIAMAPKIGYRATLGLRFNRNFSLEIGMSEARPTIRITGDTGDSRLRTFSQPVRLHDVRMSVGYLVPL